MTMLLIHDGEVTKFIVDKTFVLDLTKEYCDPNYIIEAPAESMISDTGLLTIFQLQAKALNTKFVCRWDENKGVVDIDMYKDGRIFTEFKNVKKGYIGHHLDLVSKGSEPKKFRLYIETPGNLIFKGYITVNTSHTIDIVATDDIHIDFEPPNKIIVTSKNKKT